MSYLSVRDLKVEFPTEDGVVHAVNGISFELERGQTLGIVGESGSGKSVTSQAILGLLKGSSARVTGSILLNGRDVVTTSERDMQSLRGETMAMIFQDPLSAMHPMYSVGDQIREAYLVHNRRRLGGGRKAKVKARQHVVEMLDRVGISNPHRRYDEYPHQFSGGMRQRAMIAMALICNPQLLVADEPTTALDVTVQAQILELMKSLQREFTTAIILITHDLGVVAESCDDVLVMYGGQCVEQGSVQDIFYRPQMPYTWGLLGSMPRMDQARTERLKPIPGQPPSLLSMPQGCVFHPRCGYRDRVLDCACETIHPELVAVDDAATANASVREHRKRCHLSVTQRQEIWSQEVSVGL